MIKISTGSKDPIDFSGSVAMAASGSMVATITTVILATCERLSLDTARVSLNIMFSLTGSANNTLNVTNIPIQAEANQSISCQLLTTGGLLAPHGGSFAGSSISIRNSTATNLYLNANQNLRMSGTYQIRRSVEG